LRIVCREAARAAGLSKRVTVHTLRHYAGFRTIPGELAFELTGAGLASIFPA
jgi:hypothetical protein